jgi:hypothetical protein
MPEIVHWLLANPIRWLLPATAIACAFGIPLMLMREKRDRQPQSPWLGLSTAEQAAHDRNVLDAYDRAAEHAAEAAERIVREAAERMAHLYD